MSLRSRPPDLEALRSRVEQEEVGYLPPPLGRPFTIGQLLPVEDAGPWRGPSEAEWLARISPWPVPWIANGSTVVWS